jgi:hypothetical protein
MPAQVQRKQYGTNTPFKQAQKAIWGTDVFDDGVLVADNDNKKIAANDNDPYAHLPKNIADAMRAQDKKRQQNLPQAAQEKIAGKYTNQESKEPEFYQHEETGSGLASGAFLPDSVKNVLDPERVYGSKPTNDTGTDPEPTNLELENQRQRRQEEKHLESLIAHNDFDRALAFQQIMQINTERRREAERRERVRKLIPQVQAEFKKDNLSISRSEAIKVIENGFRAPFPWIMFSLAIFKDLADIFVSVITLGLLSMSGIFAATAVLLPFAGVPAGVSAALNFGYKIVTISFAGFIFIWARRYGQKSKSDKLSSISKKLTMKFLKRRGWTFLLKFIPLIEAIPTNTYIIYSFYNPRRKTAIRLRKLGIK